MSKHRTRPSAHYNLPKWLRVGPALDSSGARYLTDFSEEGIRLFRSFLMTPGKGKSQNTYHLRWHILDYRDQVTVVISKKDNHRCTCTPRSKDAWSPLAPGTPPLCRHIEMLLLFRQAKNLDRLDREYLADLQQSGRAEV